jgi:hypothetical protein
MRRGQPQHKIKEPEEFYFPLRGALDLITPPYQIQPGRMLDCFRYEVAASGGYKPMDGYERVDGNGLPSAAAFQYLEFTDPLLSLAVGTVLTGATSGATGIVLLAGGADFGDGYGFVNLDGKTAVYLSSSIPLATGEDITISGSPAGTIETAYTPNTENVDSHEMYFKWLAVEMRRSLVQAVPGAGPVHPWRYNGTLYAFRDNADRTACFMWKEDPAAGWALVTTPALLPGGSYRFENTNFGGSAATIKMYGVDGKNKAFEFDGTAFNQITTGMAVDAPVAIREHKLHLFLAFPGGSLQHSPITNPRGAWSVVIGAGELGMGEEINDLVSLPGGVLGIWCKDSIHLLTGSSSADWHRETHSKETGGTKGTVQNAGRVVFLNNTGLAELSATNAFGSFKNATISEGIQPLIDMRKSIAVASVGVTSKNQYRIFFEDGYCLTATFKGREVLFTQSHYDVVVRSISAPTRADDELGNIYFGSDDGFVYKMDSGVSLDHRPMSAYCRLPYSHQSAPRRKKRYREVVIELDSFGGKQLFLQFCPDFSLTTPDIPQHQLVDVSETTGNAGIWDVVDWNNFNWVQSDGGGGGGGTASGRVDGVAPEMGLMLYFNAVNTITPLHTLNGVFVYFNFLGRVR